MLHWKLLQGNGCDPASYNITLFLTYCVHSCFYLLIPYPWLGPPYFLLPDSACTAGDLGSIPGWGRCPGEGNGSPLQRSSLESCVDCMVPGVTRGRHAWDARPFTSFFPLGTVGLFPGSVCSLLHIQWFVLLFGFLMSVVVQYLSWILLSMWYSPGHPCCSGGAIAFFV